MIVHVLAACVLWNTLYLGAIRNCTAPGKIDQFALFSDSIWCNPDYYAEWRHHRSKKYFGDVTNLYDVTIRRFMYISYTFSRKTGLFWFVNLLPEFTKNVIKGLLSLVGYLVHLRHSWQNGENDKVRHWDRELKVFPLSRKWNCTQFCKITTGHGNTIEDLANMMVFLLARNFISIHAKTWSVFVSKEIVQWPT